MATFQETWVLAYDDVPTQTTATVQFQNTVFRMKTFLVGADPSNSNGAWTVQGSSDATTANSSDNWSASTDVTNDISGNAHSWIVLRSPTGWLPNSAYMELLIDCNKDETGGNPGTEELQFHMTSSLNPYDISSGTTTAAPGLTNANDTERELTSNAASDPQILENDPTLNNHRLHLVRNERGDFVIIVSQDSTGDVDWWITVLSAELPSSANHNFPVFAIAKRDTLDALNPSSGNQWFGNGWNGSGLRVISGQGAIIPCPHMDNMNGTSWDSLNGNVIPRFPMDLYQNSSNPLSVGYMGRIPDIMFAANQTGVGASSELDTNPGMDSFRYVKINGLYLPIADGESAPTL